MAATKIERGYLKDPGISYGRFRPLNRMDGKAIVYDPELPLGQRTVGGRVFDTFEAADGYARECYAQPPPCPAASPAAPPSPPPGPASPSPTPSSKTSPP
jgi:hypothetical protein